MPADEAQIENVLDAAFGPGRQTKTAYRVRVGMTPVRQLSFVAEDVSGVMTGSIQCWPVELRVRVLSKNAECQHERPGEHPVGTPSSCKQDQQIIPLIMLGPVAVLPGLQRAGVGKALMKAVLSVADRHAMPPMMLIGDAEYYGRFGFVADVATHWELPGPFERHRLLVRNAAGTSLPAHGTLGPFSGTDLSCFTPADTEL